MIARWIALLTMITLPVQGLAVLHCHGVNIVGPKAEHERTPHFHFSHVHHHVSQHGHGHDHGSHHHGLDDRDHSRDEGHDDSSSPPMQQHDDTAVYVTCDLMVDHAPVRVRTSDRSIGFSVDDLFLSSAYGVFHRRLNPPPPDIGGFPLFLKTASLRL
jgi:hypothetical protein